MTQPVDVKLIERDDGVFDIDVDENGDLVTDEGFGTTIRLTVFGRRRATEDEVPEPEYRGGWIGNLLSDIPGFEAGSKLWLLKQARLNDETLNAAKSYLTDARSWFVEDGLAKSMEVDIERRASKIVAAIRVDDEPFYMDLWNLTDFDNE